MGAVVLGTGPDKPRARIGLVLSAGGLTGAAWMTGALPALQQRLPQPAGDVEMIVGTSAGSVLTAGLRCQASIEEMVGYQRGEAVPGLAGLPAIHDGPLPPVPQPRMGSPLLWCTALLTPHRVHPRVSATAWLPHGRGQHTGLRAMVHHLQARHHATRGAVRPWWADGRTWIVAVDYDSGQRVVFGRAGAPAAPLPDAVVASCSIPGWYRPARIGGRRYVDGGVRSLTSLGLLAEVGLDEVYVLAPMASTARTRHARRTSGWNGPCAAWPPVRCCATPAGSAPAASRSPCSPPAPRTWPRWASTPWTPARPAVVETSLRTSPAALAHPRSLS